MKRTIFFLLLNITIKILACLMYLVTVEPVLEISFITTINNIMLSEPLDSSNCLESQQWINSKHKEHLVMKLKSKLEFLNKHKH